MIALHDCFGTPYSGPANVPMLSPLRLCGSGASATTVYRKGAPHHSRGRNLEEAEVPRTQVTTPWDFKTIISEVPLDA
jgi:hypothetical protein